MANQSSASRSVFTALLWKKWSNELRKNKVNIYFEGLIV